MSLAGRSLETPALNETDCVTNTVVESLILGCGRLGMKFHFLYLDSLMMCFLGVLLKATHLNSRYQFFLNIKVQHFYSHFVICYCLSLFHFIL